MGNKNDRFVISFATARRLFLALRHGDNPLNGYSICAFPDAADKQTPEIGYMSGHLTWYFGEEPKKMGMNIINDDITGRVHMDRKLLTSDSPIAANALGKLAAQEMLALTRVNSVTFECKRTSIAATLILTTWLRLFMS